MCDGSGGLIAFLSCIVHLLLMFFHLELVSLNLDIKLLELVRGLGMVSQEPLVDRLLMLELVSSLFYLQLHADCIGPGSSHNIARKMTQALPSS